MMNTTICPSCRSAITLLDTDTAPTLVQCTVCGLVINSIALSRPIEQPAPNGTPFRRSEKHLKWGVVLGLSVGGGLVLVGAAVCIALWLVSFSQSTDTTTLQSDEQQTDSEQPTINSPNQDASESEPVLGSKSSIEAELQKIREQNKERLSSKQRAIEMAEGKREALEKKRSAIPLVERMDKLDLSQDD
jgi:hypothetical protein